MNTVPTKTNSLAHPASHKRRGTHKMLRIQPACRKKARAPRRMATVSSLLRARASASAVHPLCAHRAQRYISLRQQAHAHRTASTASPSAAARTRLQTTGAKPLLAASISAVIASCVALHGVIVRATVQHHSHIREDESHANRTTPAHSTPPDRSAPRPFESPTRAYIEPH